MMQIGDLVRVKEEYRAVHHASGGFWIVLRTKRHAVVESESALCVRGNKRKWISLVVLEKL